MQKENYFTEVNIINLNRSIIESSIDGTPLAEIMQSKEYRDSFKSENDYLLNIFFPEISKYIKPSKKPKLLEFLF